MKILFISFFYEPENRVGAKRISYWAQNFKDLYPTAQVYVITSTEEAVSDGVDKMMVVNSPTISSMGLIKDKGNAWKPAIIETLNNSGIEEITHVVMSGGPFMYFGLFKYFKKKFGSKIILDYRDPFAKNPRFNNSWLKIKLKQFFEKRYNKAADLVISVNQYCLELLCGYEKEANKFKIIPNGFNEKLLPKVLVKKKGIEKRIVYAGSFYRDRNPQNLVNVIEKIEGWELHHLGKESNFINKGNKFVEHGMKSYLEMMEFISNCDAALIVTSGAPFESTTKVYDYIAMQIPILIITNGELKTGALQGELENYPVVWAENNSAAIKKAIEKVGSIKMNAFDSSKYSRNRGLQTLIQLLKHL